MDYLFFNNAKKDFNIKYRTVNVNELISNKLLFLRFHKGVAFLPIYCEMFE